MTWTKSHILRLQSFFLTQKSLPHKLNYHFIYEHFPSSSIRLVSGALWGQVDTSGTPLVPYISKATESRAEHSSLAVLMPENMFHLQRYLVTCYQEPCCALRLSLLRASEYDATVQLRVYNFFIIKFPILMATVQADHSPPANRSKVLLTATWERVPGNI